MNAQYTFRPGARIKGDPEEVGRALSDIRRKKGGLTARAVWESARPVHHPLHRYFTWDDSEAADLHRDNEARWLIASVVVTIVQGPKTLTVRAYAAIGKREDRYIETLQAISHKDTRDQLLERAAAELSWFQAKYEMLEELADVRAAIGVFLQNRRTKTTRRKVA